MFELIFRILFATTVLLVSGMTGEPPFDPTWQAVAFFSTYSFFGYAMERRNLRNAGVAGLFAVADSAFIAVLLASAGRLETFGFLCLAPPAWASLRHGADALAMAPITAGWLLIGANLFEGKGWTPVLLGQTCGVLLVGLLGAKRTQLVKVSELIEVPVELPHVKADSQEEFDLRERFRILRDHSTEVEKRARRDRMVVQIMEVMDNDREPGFSPLSRKLMDLLRVEGVSLHTCVQDGDLLTSQGSSGNVPLSVKDCALEMPDFIGEWQLKERLEKAFAAQSDSTSQAQMSCVVLKERGRIVGVLSLFDSAVGKLQEAVETVGLLVEPLAKLVRSQFSRDLERRRLNQAETLYQVAATCQGADTPASVAARVAKELWESLRLDHLSVCFLKDEEPQLVALHGQNIKVLESMSFGGGPGLAGWLATASPELSLLDARDDQRLDRTEATKMRVGSFVMVPIAFDETTFGYVTAMTNRVNGIDKPTLDMIRLVTSELTQAVGRIVNGHKDTAGLATPTEFHEAVKATPQGFLVYLDVLKREELIEAHGKAAVEFAAKKVAARIRATLPSHGLMCRRSEGDFLALVRSSDETSARRWAAQATATAAMVSTTAPDGKTRIPIAVRSKVARLAQQSDQISRVAGSV